MEEVPKCICEVKPASETILSFFDNITGEKGKCIIVNEKCPIHNKNITNYK